MLGIPILVLHERAISDGVFETALGRPRHLLHFHGCGLERDGVHECILKLVF